ncbi:Uncharacterised protein [uncultured archaeon]|nr:Uncharacterised protein [uncultured archaeon]
MERRGFIFSLDAFIAFTLTMITISLLIFTIGTPKPFYPSLEQAHQLAHDTLQALATSTDDPAQGTYLEQIIANQRGATTAQILNRVAGGNASYPNIIPPGYGYRIETYEFNKSLSGRVGWYVLYDAGAEDSGCVYKSDRCGKNFTKLSASATTFASIYVSTPKPGDSPYCYLSCFGYGPGNTHADPCNVTPCQAPISNFDVGQNSIQIVRFVVYT